MAKEQVEYRAKQNEIAKRLLDVEQSPLKEKAKKHDDVTTWIIHCLLSALVGFVLCYFGIQ